MMIVALILAILCAGLAIRESRILVAILWLALVSVLTSIMFYLVGAWLIAVIELSVGTGLATVLMVFVITMIGDENEVIHLKPIRLAFVILSVILISLLTVPFIPDTVIASQESVQTVIWQGRGLDILPQIGLTFVSMIGVLALLSEHKSAESVARDDLAIMKSVELPSRDEQAITEQEAA